MKLSYDLHIHSCLSPCGDDLMTPGNIVGMAKICGLDVIAITDHNSCKNIAVAIHHGKIHDILIIPGMELNTAEEVHVLCYFPTLEDALNFDEHVYENLLPIKNNPEIFGKQEIYNEEDVPIGIEEKLLINATSIPFDDVYTLVSSYNGIMVPAHIDKSSNSIISNLGFVPPESQFNTFEIANTDSLDELLSSNPCLQTCNYITNSDAHLLEKINEAVNFLDVSEKTVASIFEALSKKFK